MHFSIPDTQDISEGNNTYTVFNLHINGVYHCSLRYRQLHSFHEQLKKEYGAQFLPPFPPKKLLSLTPVQLEERRLHLERYIQIISQNQQIATGETFNGFLLNAQQSSQQEEPEEVTLDVYLMNGHKITINILSTDQTDDVLESVSAEIQLADDFVYYFGLFLIKKEEGSDNAIVRKLQEFESPFISLKAANRDGVHRIVLRKSYWDAAFDDDLIEDRIAMNLIYVQAVNDVERGWVVANKDQHRQLTSLQQRGSKKEYLRLAKTLKFYSHLQFKPCTVDIPTVGSRAIVAAGNRELTFRIQTGKEGGSDADKEEIIERSFKVTRMRCWRITTTIAETNGEPLLNAAPTKLELAFEYLVAKDTLKWITITSDQAILMSMCLQGMVDELIMKKQGQRIKRPSDRHRGPNGSKGRPHLSRDVSSSSLRSPSSPTEIPYKISPASVTTKYPRHQPRSISSSSETFSRSFEDRAVYSGPNGPMVFKISPAILDDTISSTSDTMSPSPLTNVSSIVTDPDGVSSHGSTPSSGGTLSGSGFNTSTSDLFDPDNLDSPSGAVLRTGRESAGAPREYCRAGVIIVSPRRRVASPGQPNEPNLNHQYTQTDVLLKDETMEKLQKIEDKVDALQACINTLGNRNLMPFQSASRTDLHSLLPGYQNYGSTEGLSTSSRRSSVGSYHSCLQF